MKNSYKKALTLILFTIAVQQANAQLNPLGAQYYINQYLANPALAGSSQGLKVNAITRKLWSNVPGSPATQNLSADYGFDKVGVGFILNTEKSGLERQTRFVGSYAYHLPLNNTDEQLHFGVSLGIMNQHLDRSEYYGNPNDPQAENYDNRKTYFDGDFGFAYTSKNLNIQAAAPNLKNLLKKDVGTVSDMPTFYTAVSYKITLGEGTSEADLEPKVAFRGVKGYDNIIDAGGQLTFANKQVFIMGLYHSTKNATYALGMDYQKKYLISAMYTSQTSALSSYTNGSFELSLRLYLPK